MSRKAVWTSLLAALLAACGAGRNPSGTVPQRGALAAPAAVALADHADADHTVIAGGLQDLDKTAERLLGTLESLPEPTRSEVAAAISRRKIVELFGFDPTRRAGWDDIGVDAAAGVLFVLDDRWPVGADVTRQVVAFVRLSQPERWRTLLRTKGAVFSEENGVETCQIGGLTLWLAPSGGDVALTVPLALRTPEAKDAARKVFLQVAQQPSRPLAQAAAWQAAVRDGGRPWLNVWARTRDLGAGSDAADSADVAHFAKLFPHVAWWLGEGWALRLGTLPVAHQSLADMFVPEKAAPACAALVPAEGWGAVRASLHLDKFVDGALRLAPPSMSSEARAMLAASVSSALALSGLPPGDVMAAWSGHLCAAVELGSVPLALSGAALPNWLLVLGVQDGAKADAVLAALADRWRNAANLPIQTVTIGGLQGWATQVGPLGLAVVRDGERLVAGPSPAAVAEALARPRGASLAGSPLADALDGRVLLGGVVDLHTARDLLQSALAGQHPQDDARSKLIADAFGAVMGSARLASIALRLDGEMLTLGPGGGAEAGWSGGTMLGVLAAVAIPAFQRYVAEAKAAEAKVNLAQIRQAALAFWQAEHADARTGKPAPQRFPQSTVVTPGVSCCDPVVDRDNDQRCDVDATPWLQVGWQELGFQPDGPHNYRYRFESSGLGDSAQFTASAFGDLDCDGVQSTFQITARPCKTKNCKEKFRFEDHKSNPAE